MIRLNVQKTNSAVSQLEGYRAASGTDQLSKSAAQPSKPTVSTPVVVENADLAHYGFTLLNGELADARDFNFAWAYDPHGTAAGLPDLALPIETLRDKPVFGLLGDWDQVTPGVQNVRNQIDTGVNLAGSEDGIITWGYYDFQRKLGPNSNGEHKLFTPFTEAQKAAAVISIGNWDELIATDFQLVDYDEHDARQWARGEAPDILLANTATGPAQAWAYLPTEGGRGAWHRAAGDVWIADPRFNTSNAELFPSGYGLQTLNHELGHSLGLTHPGDYDFGDDTDGDGEPDPITYEGDAFYFQDSHQYSIMSYFDSYETGNNVVDWNLMRVMYPSTPMVHDVWIAQQKYGVEWSTRDGDSTYGFGSSGDVTNEAMKFYDGERHTIFTIWDGGGIDTLNLSGYYTPSIIDLREGAYSSAGGLGAYDPAWVGATPDDDLAAYLAFINTNNAELGLAARTAVLDLYFVGKTDPLTNEGVPWSDIVGRDWLMENNIGIAYGAVIENAVGGHGDDRINGNHATNRFWGNDGADTFIIADYDGTTLAGDLRVDNSVDVIEDFDRLENDVIDVSELGVTGVGQLSFNDATDTVTVISTGLQFKIIGASDIQTSDFFFAS